MEDEQNGLDDVARLAKIGSLPQERENMRRWADKHGVAGELSRLAVDVLASVPAVLAQVTIHDAAGHELVHKAPAGVRIDALELQRDARIHLQRAAAVALGGVARTRLWRNAKPPETLTRLAMRLREILRRFDVAELAGLRFVATRPVMLDASTGRCRAVLADKPGAEVQLLLAGYEHTSLQASCSACSSEACPHRAALAARMLDACLDPRDRLHDSLVEFAHAPAWQRFLDAVARPPEGHASPLDLHFVLRHDGGQVVVGVTRDPGQGLRSERSLKLASPHQLLRSRQAREPDRSVLAAMARCARTRGPELVPASVELLRALVDHPRLAHVGDGKPIRLLERKVRVKLATAKGGVRPSVSFGDRPLQALATDRYALIESDRGQPLVFAVLTPSIQRLLDALKQFRGVLPPDSYAALAPWLHSLREHVDLEVPEAVTGQEVPPPDKLLLRVHAYPARGCELSLHARAFPLAPLWHPGEGDEVVHGVMHGRAVFTRRDLARERKVAKRVVGALQLTQEDPPGESLLRLPRPGSYAVTTDEHALEVLSRAAQLGDVLEIEWSEHERRIRPVGRVESSDLRIELTFSLGAFKVEGSAAFNGVELSFRRLLEAALAGHRYVRVEGRGYAEIQDELLTRLRDAQSTLSLTARELRVILAMAPSFLEAFDGQIVAADTPTLDWIDRLRHPNAFTPDLDPRFEAVLRPYQREGVRWLLQRSAWSPGACLADEMGLGKTVQAIAVIAHRASIGPTLVVAPTSVLTNWRSELARFAPDLDASTYHGSERRSLLQGLGASAVLVTSYDVMLRDREQLAAHRFATIVVDEAQMIRNERTRRARALQSIPAEFRVALTGTPIENRTGDLWSLLRWIAPGLLGEWQAFRALVGVPLERGRDATRAERLRSVVRPVLLRRTKAEVLAELPARTDVVHRVELSANERALYDAAVKRARLALRRKKRERDEHQDPADRERDSGIKLLAELTRLRQLACHARLVIPDDKIESSKLSALLRLLADILPRGHRALVFSSFTSLLGLVREALDSQGISWLYLDGATPATERGQLVQRFQAGEADLFLISLKAGGTGLNLTAADYVIHLDPWWNPAAQNQASDRAHRIGQTRPVTVVKLVAHRTIEERMLELQEQKRWLANTVLVSDDDTSEVDLELLGASSILGFEKGVCVACT